MGVHFHMFLISLSLLLSKIGAILSVSSSHIAMSGKRIRHYKSLKGSEALEDPSAKSFRTQSLSQCCSEFLWWAPPVTANIRLFTAEVARMSYGEEMLACG